MKNGLLDITEQPDGDSDPERVLIADDDPQIVGLLKDCLEDTYSVFAACNGNEAVESFERYCPHLVVLDIMMPGLDGFEVISRLRELSEIPVIMLSARGETEDKVKCLSLGADDYLTKPFAVVELMARINALLRRSRKDWPSPDRSSFAYGSFSVDIPAHRVSVDSRDVKLTHTEFGLLSELVFHKDQVLTYDYLLHHVWGPEYRTEREYLHVYINRLRSKLNLDGSGAINIFNVSGTGYCLKLQE